MPVRCYGRPLNMRGTLAVLACFTLAACAESSIIGAYVPPSMPTTAAASEGIKKAATEEKLTGPIEMSDLRETDLGSGRFVLFIRGVESKYRRVGTYAVFFDNNDYKGSRMSVMMDDCEKQDYRPFP